MLEPDTQIVPPRENHAVEPRPSRSMGEPMLLRRWVGRYELIHRLAHGGMATVYLGRAKGQAGFEKVVAVKLIHPHLAGEAEFVGMFLDEARIAARIHHPHVVEILDLGESDGAYFMVMEFIEGENLSALVRALEGERLPIAVTLQILADTLEGLCAAHELRDPDGRPYRLVHRDVSPHNVLINLDGWAKVGDFGIMKAAGKASNTKTGELRGKLAYMSPEQARGLDVDHRTDLFAVGVIGWELLTGERLFASPTEAATLDRVVRCEVPRLDTFADSLFTGAGGGSLQAGLQQLLDRALASDVDQRPSDAAAMLVDVKRMLRLADELGFPHATEPRAYLGGLMRRFFSRRVEYARAALRRTGEHDAVPEPNESARSSGDLTRGLLDPTLHVARAPSGAHVTLERTPTPSNPGPATGSHPGTSTTGPISSGSQLAIVRPNPLVQWSLWLLLPMLGAGIAIAAMLSIGPRWGGQAEQPAPERAPEPRAQPPASLAATQYQPVAQRPTPAGHVRWYFSTTPRGAQVLIDGEVQGDETPTWVYVPIGEEPLDIRIELVGYEAKTLQLPAVHDQTFAETLEPLAVEAGPSEPTADKPAKRVRNPGKPKQPAETTNPSGFVPVPESLRDSKPK